MEEEAKKCPIDKFSKNEAVTMTAISLLKDGKSSIWIPDGFDHDLVDKLFDPVIDELKMSELDIQPN